VCLTHNGLQAHPRQRSDIAHDAPPEAELPPFEGTRSHDLTNCDAPRGAHKNLPELSSKMSCPQYDSTSKYITHIQQCMTMEQPNKPMPHKYSWNYAGSPR